MDLAGTAAERGLAKATGRAADYRAKAQAQAEKARDAAPIQMRIPESRRIRERAARDAGAKTLVLFHHDPDSTDRAVDTILRNARDEFDSVFAASEGMVITLGSPGDQVQAHMPGTRTSLQREAQFRARVSGLTESGRPFEEETMVRDLSLQGALISLEHAPRLQSELQVTMEAPGSNGAQSMVLKGYVVRIDAGAEQGHSTVGVVFTD